MPAKDIYHDTVIKALIKSGWKITHDPYRIKWKKKNLFIDLGASKTTNSDRIDKIAIEVKSFIGKSNIEDLEKAVGQYILYRTVLDRIEPDRELLLAIDNFTFEDIFIDAIGELLLSDKIVKLLVFDPRAEVILKWKP